MVLLYIRIFTATLCLNLVLILGSGVAGLSANYFNGVSAYVKDYRGALREGIALSKKGDTATQFNLSLMYAIGQGFTKDNKTSFKSYKRVVRRGDASAQHNLGMMYGLISE